MLPSQTLPLPWLAPKPVPVMVICVPAMAVVGVTLVMFGVLTVKFTVLDHTPPCNTWATPVFEPEATLATICVSLQLTTTPYVLPNQTFPLP